MNPVIADVAAGLLPVLEEYQPDLLLLGGQIAKSFSWFGKELERECEKRKIRIQAYLVDNKGRNVQKRNRNKKLESICFEGGAGVQPEKLQPAAAEPADFDAFWAKQKAKLAAVPLKSKMEKIKSTKNVDIYAVTVDCA